MTSAISGGNYQQQQTIAEQIITEKEEQSEIVESSTNKEEELPTDIKAQLVDRLEQEILGNIDVNFLFH